MPYIKNGRKFLEFKSDVNSAGELNYAISYIIHNYLKKSGVSYTKLNEVIGVLECAKLELYRKVAAPYEDEKQAENGSVSSLDQPKLEATLVDFNKLNSD